MAVGRTSRRLCPKLRALASCGSARRISGREFASFLNKAGTDEPAGTVRLADYVQLLDKVAPHRFAGRKIALWGTMIKRGEDAVSGGCRHRRPYGRGLSVHRTLREARQRARRPLPRPLGGREVPAIAWR